jgi:DNA-binding transcriptional LysR family regulator
MKVNFDGIQAFVLVAELKSFKKAADYLHLTQTALTRRIQKLESELGMRLLERTTRSVELSAIGREFLPEAQKLVNETTLAVTRLKEKSLHSSGDVTIACIPTMAYHRLPERIRDYSRRYPGNRIRILDWPSSQVNEAVADGRADFGITILLDGRPPLEEEIILEDPYMFFCRADHPLSGMKEVSWEDLREVELISVSNLSGNRLLLDYHLSQQQLELRGFYEVQHITTAIGLVLAGIGSAILPYSTLQAPSPTLQRIPLVRPVIHRRIALIRRPNATLSPAAQALYDLISKSR